MTETIYQKLSDVEKQVEVIGASQKALAQRMGKEMDELKDSLHLVHKELAEIKAMLATVLAAVTPPPPGPPASIVLTLGTAVPQ